MTYKSLAAEDGFLIERSENANTGSRRNASARGAGAIRIGDQRRDRQYKSMLSFDTSTLPHNAVITGVSLEITRGSSQGQNVFDTHGTANVHIKRGYFGNSSALEVIDFESTADAVAQSVIGDKARNSRYQIDLTAEKDFINPAGRTQMRLSMSLDDNDDQDNDWAGFYSSDNANSSRHPALIVEYTLAPATSQ